MSLISLILRAPGKNNPFLDRASQRSNAEVVNKAVEVVGSVVSGAGIPSRQGQSGTGSREVASLEYATGTARATVTCAAVANADTVTPNGQAVTATQHRATATVTFATALDDCTITVNGVVYTGKAASPDSADNEFLVGVSDTDDAAAFVALLNASRPADVGVYGLIKARSALGVVTFYAVTGGTAGNAYTLASSDDAATLVISAATFANGAAVANNEFDYVGTNETTARALADCINNSTTAALSQHVKASTRRAIVTCASVEVGDYVDVDQTRLRAVAETTDSGGARITTFADDVWCQASTNTNDGTSLANCINNHPRLRDRFFAVNASGAVSIYERWPEATAAPSIATSNGTRLAVTGSATLFADSAACLIQSLQPGYAGNAKTLVTSNGTRLAVTNDSSGKLTGGASATATF